ncbi:class III extradiol ring-cleavage dioxygenase [Mesorhizobium sp. DCY119]|uniref:DODA-type extradiol aromatic ring-opening family dioxygenase n=1 Tax=Mesorhizobium sp. DCY119 TaxID=2108445 RepID=UPI000E6CD9E8|nr:class III extradiol ring-cleavage dioxygenase [Mesorhizobium sp. DCY119]RJG44968.1 dioxygenase [Mesorhizobium sp. DCY119]
MTTMPTLFISHGGPNIVISDTPARHYLETISDRIPAPKAIVIVSAHFETHGVTVVTDPRPEMIYDFGGFAPELYKMIYAAPGAPELAERVLTLLEQAGLDPARLGKRGYDHGTWTPLKLAFPQANIPIVQVSIDPNRDAAWHYAVGQALSPLREDGVLLIGSGHITHNLRAFFSVMRQGAAPDPSLAAKVNAFTEWFEERLAANDKASILDWKNKAPFPAENHPTDEHLMPIFFAYGAAGDKVRAERVHDSVDHGFFANDSYLFH